MAKSDRDRHVIRLANHLLEIMFDSEAVTRISFCLHFRAVVYFVLVFVVHLLVHTWILFCLLMFLSNKLPFMPVLCVNIGILSNGYNTVSGNFVSSSKV